MSYQRNQIRSDRAPITVMASQAIGLTVAAAIESTTICMQDHTEVDWSYLVASLGGGPITEIRFRVLWSMEVTPGTFAAAPEDWNPLLADDAIAAGLVTVDEYTLSCIVASFDNLAVLPGSIGLTAPRRGLNMKTLVWSEAGAVAGSDFSAQAVRRV